LPRTILLFALLVPLLARPAAGAGEADLARLRAEHARNFTDPLTHLRLARHHQQHGRGLLAFAIVESLRRQAPEAFRSTFAVVFGAEPIDAGDERLEALVAEHAGRPDDVALAEQVGRVLLARGELERASVFFVRCSELEPDERKHVENLADVLNRQRKARRGAELLERWDAAHPGHALERVDAVQAALDAVDLGTAKRLVKEALAAYPGECELYAQRGQIFAAEGKGAEAERYLLQAVQLCPERARLHATLGSFAMLMKRDPVQALDHYLDAYFRDPNHHDGDYVDARIRALSSSLAEALVGKRHGTCNSAACLAEMLRDDNPAITRWALAHADSAWGPELERPLLSLLGHDDPDARAGAMLLLAKHADEDFNLRLGALLGSTDPRRLGMGAHLAVRLQGREGRASVKVLLEHPDELVRFDVITALALEGGPSGRLQAAEHAPHEESLQLRELATRLGGEGS